MQWHKWIHIYHTGTSATYTNIFHRKQDGIGPYKNLTFTNTSEVLFQVLVINHMYFYITEFSYRLQNHETSQGLHIYKCLPVYRPKGKQVNVTLILSTHFSSINFGHKIYWNRFFLFRQNNNVHIFFLEQLIYEGSEVLLSKVKVYFLGGYRILSSGWDVSETVSLPDVNLSYIVTVFCMIWLALIISLSKQYFG